MRIEYVQKNYVMDEKVKGIIEKKLDKLSRYFEDNAVCKVTLKQQNNIEKMEVSISFGSMFIRAEVSEGSMYDNIDLILPRIEKQIFKYKTKLQKQLKSSAYKDFAPDYGKDIQQPKVVRIKKFDLRPMHIEDAVMELDLVDHDFYVYLDEETKDVNIVYRRADGDIGVLQPV